MYAPIVNFLFPPQSTGCQFPKGRNKLPHAIVLSKSYTEGPGQGMRGSCREVPTLLSEQCCVSAEGALFPLP